jgi:hypothetical protein
VPSLRQISSASRRLGRWPIALAACFVLAAAVLVPSVGRSGLWEPGERGLADRVALPQDVEAERAARQLLTSVQTVVEIAKPLATPRPTTPESQACPRAVPADAVARSLTTRAIRAGRDHISDDDTGRKLPLALLGLITVLAAAGAAMRIAGARAGLIATIALLSMPLLVLQARLLTSELGTAAGGSLIIYALTALARPYRGRGVLGLVLDVLAATAALAAGVALGFLGGGALLGLAVPIGAFAAAGGLGAPFVLAGVRRIKRRLLRRRPAPIAAAAGDDSATATPSLAAELPGLLATLAVFGVLGLLAWQIYDVKDPHPGIVPQARQVLGQAIVPEGCWSWALGGVWRAEDDLRFIYDSSFEQIGYGTFPWGVLGLIAMAALLRDPDPARRFAGALALAWAGAAWIATEAFQRKVGYAIWAGFPALALAVGVWFDAVLDRRARGATTAEPAADPTDAADAADAAVPADAAATPAPAAAPFPAATAMLVGLFFVIAVIDLGKDMFSFAEKVTSLLAGGEQVAYPKPAKLLFLPARLWPLLLGAITAIGFAVWLIAWRPGPDAASRSRRRAAGYGAAASLAASVAAAAFWAFAWHPELSHYLSSRTIFETYRELRQPGDELVIMGDLGQAPLAYGDACNTTPPPGVPPPATPPPITPECQQKKLEVVQTRDQIVRALQRKTRVFAIAPQGELCSLHREVGESPYFVLEERNLRNLLLSNRLDGATDKNPLAEVIVHAEPKGIPNRPKARVTFEDKIELLGWAMPAEAGRGESFDITLYYKILQPVGSTWKSFMHFDGPAGRAGNADHEPIGGRCSTATWQPGDYIIDRFKASVGSGAYPAGRVDVWFGFFTGSMPSFRNMPVGKDVPQDLRDQHERVKLTSIVLD